jgi:hypothetical protein
MVDLGDRRKAAASHDAESIGANSRASVSSMADQINGESP